MHDYVNIMLIESHHNKLIVGVNSATYIVNSFGGHMKEHHQFQLDYIDTIAIVDQTGTIMYSVRFNPRFDDDLKDSEHHNIINRNILEVFPSLTPETSTILQCLKHGRPIYKEYQEFVDFKGNVLKTTNVTIPIIKHGAVVAVIELTKDITTVKDMAKKKTKEQLLPYPDFKRPFFNFDDFITCNSDMLKTIEYARKIANNVSNIMVYGETGVGKEMIVQSIHEASTMKNGPFIAQNCAAIPETLFESILFGTVKGAYTGAVDRQGLFEMAKGGTLFLDELNSMPLHLQAKLLRVLQDGRIRRIGDEKDIQIQVRVIGAMNCSPSKALESRLLREDLFYRLNVNSIHLMPLRKRPDDITLLTNYFIEKRSADKGISNVSISPEVQEFFINYPWPGNTRELKHIIEGAVNVIEGDLIRMGDLPAYLLNAESDSNEVELISPVRSLQDVVEKAERKAIIETLMITKNNVTRAAQMLGITRQNLHHKIKRMKINQGLV